MLHKSFYTTKPLLTKNSYSSIDNDKLITLNFYSNCLIHQYASRLSSLTGDLHFESA